MVHASAYLFGLWKDSSIHFANIYWASVLSGKVLGNGNTAVNKVDQSPSPPGAQPGESGCQRTAVRMDTAAELSPSVPISEPVFPRGDARGLGLVDWLTGTPTASLTLTMFLISLLPLPSLDICQEAYVIMPQPTRNYSWEMRKA